MNGNAVLRFAPGVRLRIESDQTAFLLFPEGVVELSETARAILELVDGVRTADDIAAVLSERYDAPTDQIRADVAQSYAALRQRGFLQA